MAVKKVFTDEFENELTTYMNANDMCFIAVKNNEFEDMYSQHIVLDSDDLLELINELVYIREQMNKE